MEGRRGGGVGGMTSLPSLIKQETSDYVIRRILVELITHQVNFFCISA